MDDTRLETLAAVLAEYGWTLPPMSYDDVQERLYRLNADLSQIYAPADPQWVTDYDAETDF